MFNTSCFSTATMVAQTHLNIMLLCYTYIACLSFFILGTWFIVCQFYSVCTVYIMAVCVYVCVCVCVCVRERERERERCTIGKISTHSLSYCFSLLLPLKRGEARIH